MGQLKGDHLNKIDTKIFYLRYQEHSKFLYIYIDILLQKPKGLIEIS